MTDTWLQRDAMQGHYIILCKLAISFTFGSLLVTLKVNCSYFSMLTLVICMTTTVLRLRHFLALLLSELNISSQNVFGHSSVDSHTLALWRLDSDVFLCGRARGVHGTILYYTDRHCIYAHSSTLIYASAINA